MCWRARKCAQQKKDLTAFLFIIRSCSATLWSCWITDPACSEAWYAKAAWLALMWASLFAWAWFFQLLSSSWWMALLSILHLFIRETFLMSCTVYRMHLHNQHHTLTKESLFLVLPAATTCCTILRFFPWRFRCTNTGLLHHRNFSLFFTATTISTDVHGLLDHPK